MKILARLLYRRSAPLITLEKQVDGAWLGIAVPASSAVHLRQDGWTDFTYATAG